MQWKLHIHKGTVDIWSISLAITVNITANGISETLSKCNI
jgi:hypothetical protein